MEIQRKRPTAQAPAETFTGDAWYDVIAAGESPSRLRVNVVRFAPGARNAWHAGAAPEHFMTHLAMWEALADGQDGPETQWGDHVTDEEYGVCQ